MSHLIVLGKGWLGTAIERAASGRIPTTVIDPPFEPALAPRDARATATLAELVASAGASLVINACGRITGTDAELDDANHLFPVWLCEALSGTGVRLVHIGSASEYGDPGASAPVGEDTVPRPTGAYATTKAAGTAAVLEARARGLDAVVARVFNIVGSPIPEVSPIHQWVEDLRALGPGGGDVVVWWPPTTRDFVAIDDAARALIDLGGPGARPPIVNVCSGVGLAFGDIVSELARHLGVEARIRSMERPGIPVVVGDPTELRRQIGWVPAMSLARLADEVL